MKKYKMIWGLGFLFLLGACQSAPAIKGFDAQVWKQDKKGCAGKRIELIDTLLAQKSELLQLTPNETIRYLGTPDQQELYEHRQRFFKYFVDPSPTCASQDSLHRYLQIRYDALDKSSEIVVQQEVF